MEKELKLSEKEEIIQDFNFDDHEDYKYKISAFPLQCNIYQDSYREQLVSLFQMAPLIKKTVPIEEADYILYSNPFARVQDFSDVVLEELKWIDEVRKPGAEIIICGKATNIKSEIEGKYSNITYVPSHYTEYVGKRFDIDMKEEYVVYDDRNGALNIWPVDGCTHKCGFCRRSYMHIPFESQPIEKLRERLDWFKEHHPEQMKYVSLRAENLTLYGLDINNKKTLNEVIDLIDSYDEVKYIDLSIGLCIGDLTKDITNSICKSNKIVGMAIYLETGSDRLLELIGKKHTIEKAKEFVEKIRKFHPNINIEAAVMIGLPTEGLDDVLALAKFLVDLDIDHVLCNYYGHSPKNPLDAYEQLSDNVKKLHMKYLIKYMKEYYTKYDDLVLEHETFYDSSKRSVNKELEKIAEEQKDVRGRIWYGVTYEHFVGDNIIVKSDKKELSIDELINEKVRIAKQRKLI